MAKVYVVEVDRPTHKSVDGIYTSLEAAQQSCERPYLSPLNWKQHGKVWVSRDFDIQEWDIPDE